MSVQFGYCHDLHLLKNRLIYYYVTADNVDFGGFGNCVHIFGVVQVDWKLFKSVCCRSKLHHPGSERGGGR